MKLPEPIRSCLSLFSMVFRNILLLGFICSVSSSPPYFVSPPGQADVVFISENMLPGTAIYFVKVDDFDPGDILTTNSTNTPDFKLNGTIIPREFILTSKRFFTYSVRADRFHKIIISVSDGTTIATVNLTIQVVPSNNQISTMSGNFTTVIPEEMSVGTVVKLNNLKLSKPYAGNVQMYSLSGKDSSFFSINRLTGEIKIARRIDRDSGIYRTSDLHLFAYNQTGYTATASLLVVFQDINDNAPVCNPSAYYVNVIENGTNGNLVETVRCTDIDAGPNNVLNMILDPTNGNHIYFSINRNGEIRTTTKSLDYEQLASSNFQLDLIVLVKDMPTNYPQKTGTATIIVNVLPVNEFSPEWSQFSPPIKPFKHFTIQENLPVGTVIITVKAIDYDLGYDGEISYEMNTTGTEASFFRLDAITGELSVKSLIDADVKTGGKEIFILQLLAKDSGGKTSQSTTIWLMLDDVNDNDPHFNSSVYTASIAENAAVGTSVISLNATDNDLFASLSFSIVSGDARGKFRFISANRSLLQLNAVIKPDKPTQDPVFYQLKVQVKDGGVPELTAESHVMIHVQLINNHAPVFSASSTTLVNEDAIIGASVVTVTATDNDWGDDKNIVYLITAGNTGGAFSINRKNGIIQVAQALDFEILSTYRLTIVASDEGTPAMSSTMVQEIKITNTNDLPVACSDSYLYINIAENISVNTEVATLSCWDRDNLTSVTYKIGRAGIGTFQISSSGHLTVITALDYDKGSKSYTFDISISDGLYTTTVPVLVTLNPINEFAPQFLNTHITKKMREDSAIDSLVATVSVTDDDAPPHHVTKLCLQNVISPALFRLEDDTGNIRLIRELDYETKQSYSLLVVAVDGGNLKATSTVSVLIEDVNDNSPVCAKSILRMGLKEDEASGTLVSSLNCRDADTGVFGNLTYSLKQTPFGINFIVNTAGEVILQGNSLDFETIKAYQLTVIVEDGGFKQTTVLLMIDVLDVNDGPPRFPNASQTVSLLENIPLMTIIANMAANDPDEKTSPYGQLIYDILLGNNEQIFTINRHSGQITLAGNLNREKTPIYILTIRATESQSHNAGSATATLTISVLDVNDNPPNCPFLSFYRSIKESTLPGSNNAQIITLTCTDADTPAVGGTLSYSITVGDLSVFALINNTLILNSPLDFDHGKRQYLLTLTVSDSLYQVNIQGTVVVTSVDEYRPVFSSAHYSKMIPEDSIIGQIILTMTAIDQDSRDTSDGIVTYSLPSSNILPFTIDDTTGQISLVSSLDWETKAFYSFQVTASDTSHQASATVNVTVIDVNDNRPVFVKGSYSPKISETVPIGTTVVKVSATDADGPSNGNITYSIIDGNNGGEFDIIRGTGHIRTLKLLDYDAMSINSFTLRVEATDRNGASGSLSDTTLVTILLSNENEYPPVFSQNTYLVSIKESEPVGYQFLQVSSSDKDRGPDGDVYYFFTNNTSRSFFVLDSITGNFFLQRRLDFETSQRYSFNVTVSDMGSIPKTSRATVIVNVENVNDEIPDCPMSFFAKDVREDFPIQNTILTINCTDKDAGTYGQLNFLIEEVNGLIGSGSFKIDNSGQLSLASSLDYETHTVQLLKINIHDGGIPPKSTEVMVKITVLNINEAIPIFNVLPSVLTIPESSPIGHIVVKVSARDNDTADTLTYFFTTPSNEFEIDSVHGDIKVKTLLDFESKKLFSLYITAADSGTVPQSYSAQTTLTVMLSDVNDSPPVFSSSVYQRNIQENQPAGSTFATLTVTDADSGSNAQATFLIVNGDTTNTFRVTRDGAGNCDVSLATPSLLDYEQKSQYTLLIRATDSGGLSAEATLAIQVQPYNEYPPSFQNISSSLPIKEDVPIGTTLTKIAATDRDAGQDGRIFYDLTGGLGKFIIDRHSGVITVRDELDREQVDSYQLLIVAKDDGVNPSALTSTLTLTITVEDINDNNPTCAGRQQNIAFVREDLPIGTSVFSLFCTDGDRDPALKNNVLRYAITKGNNAAAFAVNASTGLLTTKAIMDREVKASYDLTIQVSDFGTPSRSVDQSVYIQITDHVVFVYLDIHKIGGITTLWQRWKEPGVGVNKKKSIIKKKSIKEKKGSTVALEPNVNDNAPVFTSNNYSVAVSESMSTANVILKVTATDSDAGDAGAVLYSILSGNANNQFALDSLTGDLKLIKNLDREAVSIYTLLIQAIDGGSPPLSAKVNVVVTLIDENDNSPSCSSSYYSVTLWENAKTGTPVISLQCTDLDIASNAILSYSIVSGNAHSSFNINPTTGNITVYSSLDAEIKTKYLLNIDVSDKVHTTKVEVEIVLLDINESPPKFMPPGPFGTHVLENSAIGSSIFQVIAKDDDASSSMIFFSFPAPNKYFSIHKMTGVVSLNDHLDRETSSTHTLTIEVTDNGSPHSLNSSAALIVIVDDVNDNNPFCSKSHYVVSLPEDTLTSTWITNISCSDVDISSPLLKYTIEAGNSSGIFEVISSTGQIFLKKNLDFETVALHTLDIRVDDNGTPSILSTRVKLIVKVLPINEHIPTFSIINNNIITVMENSSLSSLIAWVNATDDDKGEDNGEIAFGIKSGDPTGHFLIDSKTGKISLVKNLDRESQDQYRLVVIAKDCVRGFGNSLTASTTIHINVADVNDNYPEFSQTSYVLSVSENVGTGTKLLSLVAHDDDFGLNGQVVFIIESGDPTNRFTVNNIDLEVKDKLDFLKTNFYLLKIQAQDKGVPPLSSYAYVTVHVEYKNNYPPTISNGNASIILKENHTIGSIVYRVNATDQDTGNSDGLNVSISSVIPSNAPRHAFDLDQRGDIVLTASLDYDTLPNKFALIISVSDKGSPNAKPLTSTMTLSIAIENINDNAPVFIQNVYSYFVNEDTPLNTLVGQVRAVDKDFDLFGSITYYVVGGDTKDQDFELSQKDGRVFVNGSLDFERKAAYVYIVEAVDRGKPAKSGRCIVRISVQDVNDMTPEFVLSKHSLGISEDAALGTSVIKVEARDADSYANGNSDIQFSMTETTAAKNHFRIDATSGLISVHRKLDREFISKHNLIVYATDNGTPRLTGSNNITIYVTDVNDNSPVFSRTYHATISEETHIGSVVFRLTAYDRDEGKNAALTFSILSGNIDEDFWIDSTSGYLFTNRSLDRERTSRYIIRIKASDGGSPIHWAITDVTINIKDENDNKPFFLSSNYTFTIAENLPAPARVGQLMATDADIGRNGLLKYRILFMLTGPNDFNIDGGTGVITSRLKLDRESVSYYKLWCEVADDGVPSLTGYTEVNILISDENDHIPTFRQDSYEAKISEQDPIGRTVITFNITDDDEANFGLISLSILPKVGDAILAEKYFNILSTNQSLVLKRQVDREIVNAFHFVMLVQDGGIPRLSSKATVDILVGDFNDHDPVFTKTFHNLEIAYDGSCTSFLTQVKAVDQDRDDNGRITYYFVRSRYNYLFSINDITGDVKIQMRAEKNWIYLLTVYAHDYGTPQRRSMNNATLRIDTFVPTEIVASIHLGINRKDFEAEQTAFQQQLTALLQVKYPHGNFKVWCIQERDGVARSSPQAMRRLTANDQPVTVNVYCVKSNITNEEVNLKQRKDFCSRQEVLSFLTVQASGEISGALKGPAWDYFAIQEANGYGSPNEVNWASTTNGIIIIILSCLLILFICGISFGYCYWRRKKNSSVDPAGPTIEEKIASKDDDDFKKKIFRTPVLTLPSLNNKNYTNNNDHSLNKLKDKSFDGRAIDPDWLDESKNEI